MNGRNVVQIIVRQRRRRRARRVRRLAVTAMLHEEASHGGDQVRGCRGELMAAQRTGKSVICCLEEHSLEFSLILFFICGFR